MIINTEELKNACTKILTAIDNSSISTSTGLLELKTEDNILYLNVTNDEYFVQVTLGKCETDFHATVDAELFLKLVAQTTTEDIEFTVNPNTLIFKGNGTNKFTLVYGDDKQIRTLTKISILNPTLNFNIDSNILNSILNNNSKEVSKIPKGNKIAINPIQRMYYIDEQGAITFYNGACVNKFTLEKPVKLLLNSNLVRLFSLFKNTTVNFTLGYDSISETIIQTKVKFETEDICITAILNCDDTLLKSMPAQAVRDRAFNDYPYSVTLNRNILLQVINRITIFASRNEVGNYKLCGRFKFTQNSCMISDYQNQSMEEIKYANPLTTNINYETLLDLNDIHLALENSQDQFITLNFGDTQAIVIAKDNVYTVIPEGSR